MDTLILPITEIVGAGYAPSTPAASPTIALAAVVGVFVVFWFTVRRSVRVRHFLVPSSDGGEGLATPPRR